MELLVFSLFAAALLVCVIFHISLLFALLLGYVIFALYAIRKGFSLPEVLGMSAQGVRAAKNILTTFVLIGILTSLWRAGGTIPAIVCYSVRVMEPRLFLVCSFLLNCLVSFLTGTAFGSAATMGAVCMTMAAALGADPLMTGGAILSGVYFGDRWSPVSTVRRSPASKIRVVRDRTPLTRIPVSARVSREMAWEEKCSVAFRICRTVLPASSGVMILVIVSMQSLPSLFKTIPQSRRFG